MFTRSLPAGPGRVGNALLAPVLSVAAAKMGGVMTQRRLNRSLLARQGLLEPFDLPVPQVLERVGGLQAQYAPSMYIGLWSRMRSFSRDELTRALADRQVAQGTLLRGTIHLVAAADYWWFAAAVRDSLRAALQRELSAGAIQRRADRLRTALADRPLRQAEIDELVGRDARRWMNLFLDLVRVPPSGTWQRRRADVYADATAWLGPGEVSTAGAIDFLVRRYLAGFGPATRADIASWCGLPVRTVTAALQRLDHLVLEGPGGTTLVDLPGAPLPDPDHPVPVRFLPTWDATLLTHARRTQLLPEQHRPKIFSTKTPHSFPTVLVDGAVAGTWRYAGGRVELTEFDPLPPRVRRSVEEAAEVLAAFHR
jgi:CRP-like cAMP-binding protein